jgi:integrase
MGIEKYVENGRELWRVRVHKRSGKNRKIRAQKRLKGIASEEEARKLDAKWTQWAYSTIAKRENDGLTWGEVIEAWREWYRRYPSDRWDEGTVRDYLAIMYNWAPGWLKRPAGKLTVADGFQLIEDAKREGASTRRLYQVKTTVNTIYRWGVQSGKIVGSTQSPMFGIELKKRDDDPLGEILNRDEVAELLYRAERAEHEWFPIWKTAAYTGMRSGELEGLRKSDIELVSREEARRLDVSSQEKKQYGFIRVQRQWKQRTKGYGPTKGRMARTVPISSQLYWFLIDYLERNDFGSDEHGPRVFPILPEHRRGQQAFILKVFCVSEKLRPVKFHTFRACFATHLLSAGVPETQVMKVGGWKDRETMMIYVRRAGIDEAGATERLDFSRKREEGPSEAGSNVVSLFGRPR